MDTDLDDIDRELIVALQLDGRLTYAELGERVGLSAGGARLRVLRLEERGILQVVGETDNALGEALQRTSEGGIAVELRQGDGVGDLKAALAAAMPEGPWLYPEDEVSDATDRMIAAELTREQIYEQLRQELPYSAAVETETWEDRPDGSTSIRQQILVERDSQKAIVVGAGGARLKKMASAARRDMEKLFDGKVYLGTWVKVRKAWTDDARVLRQLGYE